jgi:SPP1 family holin
MKVTSGTIARLIILILAAVNQVLAILGYDIINIPNETINTLVDSVFFIVAAGIAFWKNNSFTNEALEADEYMKELKAKNKAKKGL